MRVPFVTTVLVLVLIGVTPIRAQVVLEAKSHPPAEFRMTLLPGRYSAMVRASDFRPTLELLDDSGAVLLTQEGRAELRFMVNRQGVFILRPRTDGKQGEFHIILSHLPSAPPASAAAGEGAIASSREQRVIELVNEERRKLGLPALRMNARLMQAARGHSVNMARQNTGAHELDGTGPGERIRDTGYRAMQWGENIAWGAQTPEQAMSGWMNSPGHRRNITSADVTEIGVGVVDSAAGVPYWTQVFGRP